LPDPARAEALFGIAPGGACRATPVASGAVGSYPTVSSLPRRILRRTSRAARRSHFCGAFRQVALPGRYPAPLFQGVRTFLAGACAPTRPSGSLRAVCLRLHRRCVKVERVGGALPLCADAHSPQDI